jgi:hypothetical protein
LTREERKQHNYWLIHKVENDVLYRQCFCCNEWFPETIEYFYMQNKSKPKLGFTGVCRVCNIKKSVNWVKNNKEQYEINRKRYNQTEKYKEWRKKKNEKQKENRKKWFEKFPWKNQQYQNNRDLHKKHSIKNKEWVGCKEFFNHKCCYCGISEEEHFNKYKQKLHKDHAINEGSNGIENCLPSCKSCNSKKWKTDWYDWYTENNKNFNQERYEKICEWLDLFEEEGREPNEKIK